MELPAAPGGTRAGDCPPSMKIAQTPPGGPTFLQLNEDLFEKEASGEIMSLEKFRVKTKIRAKPEDIDAAARMLLDAENPLITVGLEVMKAQASEKMVSLPSC